MDPLPHGPGAVRQILAIHDDSAVVVFTPYGSADTPDPWLALMHRDGSVSWVVAIDGQPLAGRTSTGIERVGNAISVAIAHTGDGPATLDRIETYGLEDGTRIATVRAGAGGYASETIVDRRVRFDVVLSSVGESSDIIASDAEGERWRATLSGRAVGEIVGLPAHVAVRVTEAGARYDFDTWRVLDRDSGAEIAVLPGYDGCSDGERWFVSHFDEVRAVDLATFATHAVLDVGEFPTAGLQFASDAGEGATWMLRDCAIVDGRPLAFAQLGMVEALVGRGATGEWAIQPLGIRRRRSGRTDPLPDEFHPMLALGGFDGSDTYDLILADLTKSDASGSRRAASHVGPTAVLATDGFRGPRYIVASRGAIGIVDGVTGEVIGHHVRSDAMALHRTQWNGSELWLPPPPGTRLGEAAPTVLELAEPPEDPKIRGSLADALGPDRKGKPAFACDRGVVRYDGLGTSRALGPVTPTRGPPWPAEPAAEAARAFACASPSSVVTPLAWAIVEDARPLRNHYALMMVEDRAQGGPLYTAVAMYRHATNPSWNISVSFHDPRSPLRRHRSRPTTAELDAFIDQSSFALVDRFGALLAGNVLDTNWQAVTGEAALRHFPAGIEQPD